MEQMIFLMISQVLDSQHQASMMVYILYLKRVVFDKYYVTGWLDHLDVKMRFSLPKEFNV